MIDLVNCLSVGIILFLLGLWGIVLNRKNIIIILIAIELIIAFNRALSDVRLFSPAGCRATFDTRKYEDHFIFDMLLLW